MMSDLAPYLIVAAIMITGGVLAKAFPDLIAGYNTMAAKEKEKVDVNGLSTFVRNNCVAMGITLAVLGCILKMTTGAAAGKEWIIAVVMPVWIISIGVIARKYDHNAKK